MTGTKIGERREERTGGGSEPEPPWNVVLHNEWENPLRRVILVLRKVVPGMTLKKATKVAWEAHRRGQAVVKRCHRELAELYRELLQKEGLTVSIEPAA